MLEHYGIDLQLTSYRDGVMLMEQGGETLFCYQEKAGLNAFFMS